MVASNGSFRLLAFVTYLLNDFSLICQICLSLAGTASATSSATLAQTAAAAPSYLVIAQFQIAYQLSDITADIQSRMTLAVSQVLGVDVSRVLLTFASINLRRNNLRHLLQQQGLLVTTSLAGFQGNSTAAAQLAMQLTQDNLNRRMTGLGLKQVTKVQNLLQPGNRLNEIQEDTKWILLT